MESKSLASEKDQNVKSKRSSSSEKVKTSADKNKPEVHFTSQKNHGAKKNIAKVESYAEFDFRANKKQTKNATKKLKTAVEKKLEAEAKNASTAKFEATLEAFRNILQDFINRRAEAKLKKLFTEIAAEKLREFTAKEDEEQKEALEQEEVSKLVKVALEKLNRATERVLRGASIQSAENQTENHEEVSSLVKVALSRLDQATKRFLGERDREELERQARLGLEAEEVAYLVRIATEKNDRAVKNYLLRVANKNNNALKKHENKPKKEYSESKKNEIIERVLENSIKISNSKFNLNSSRCQMSKNIALSSNKNETVQNSYKKINNPEISLSKEKILEAQRLIFKRLEELSSGDSFEFDDSKESFAKNEFGFAKNETICVSDDKGLKSSAAYSEANCYLCEEAERIINTARIGTLFDA